jgi:hypothetical protein
VTADRKVHPVAVPVRSPSKPKVLAQLQPAYRTA